MKIIKKSWSEVIDFLKDLELESSEQIEISRYWENVYTHFMINITTQGKL